MNEAESIISDWLLGALQSLGDEYGPLGVALAAASLTDQDVLITELKKGRNERQ